MQKTTKNLLTKIFVLLTVIFCVFALALGAIGCANEETKAITKISVNGTTITVEYSDGSKEDLAVEGEEYEECGHNSNVYVQKIYLEQTTEATVDVCNIQVYECSVCSHLYAKENGHDFGEKETVASTCVEKGFEGRRCKDENCKFVDGEEKDLVPHTFNIIIDVTADASVNKCETAWYEKGQICSVCDKVELVRKDALKHIGYIEEIEVFDKVGAKDGGKLGGYCSACGDNEAVLVDLPSLEADAKATAPVYVKSAEAGDGNYHVAEYIYTYEGKEYNVVGKDYKEYHTDKIEDYTAEKYADLGLKVIAGKEVVCDELGTDNMAYTCADCDTYVLVDVKAAHVKDTEKDPVKALTNPADCEKGGTLTYECVNCEDGTVVEQVAKFEHEWALKAGTEPVAILDKDGNVTGYNVILDCKACAIADKQVKADSYVAATCAEDGKVVYGETEFVLTATGIHNVEGIGKVDEKSSKSYEYAEVKNYIKTVADNKIVCASAPVKAAVDCKDCDDIVLINVVRAHDKVWSDITEEATCATEGEELFNCGYADCPYYVADAKDYGKKNVGTAPIYGGHDLSYADVVFDAEQESKEYKTGKFTVLCANNCSINNTTNVAFKLYEDRTHTCVDYAKEEPVVNTDTYKFTIGEEELEIVDEIENSIHVLNGKNVDISTAEFTVGDAGIRNVAGKLANCSEEGQGGFICELCDELALVAIKGKCEIPAQDEKVFVEDTTVGCETAMNKYWVCQLCDTKHFEEELLPAQKHSFKFVAWKDAEKTVAIVKCDCVTPIDLDSTTVPVVCELAGQTIEVKVADCTVEKGCEIDKYTFTYESEITEGFTQTGRFETPSAGHTFITEKVDNKDVEKAFYFYEYNADGKLVRVSVGFYCTTCDDYVIQAWLSGAALDAFVNASK